MEWKLAIPRRCRGCQAIFHFFPAAGDRIQGTGHNRQGIDSVTRLAFERERSASCQAPCIQPLAISSPLSRALYTIGYSLSSVGWLCS